MGMVAVYSRRIELLDELRAVHLEAARLSEMMAALAADSPTSKQLRDLMQKAYAANDRAKLLHDQLRALDDLDEEED